MTTVAPAAPPVQALVAGQALGRFTLLSDLTVRTEAPVWRARDRQLQRDVALKLPPSGAGDALGSAWMTEAQVVARLAHPNLVPLFEATVLEGRQVLVFELVPGMTLAQWLVDKGPMPARDAVALMVGVVDALRAAHEQGVVHRSLTPSCVLVDERGRGRVTDFGMAAVLGQHGAASAVGTPAYRSPEAARGEAASPLMDVFGAGLLLAELITGAPVLPDGGWRGDAETPSTIELGHDAAVDDRLRAIIERAIDPDPARRHDGAAMLRDALMQWLEPPDDHLPEPDTGHGTLDFLLRRMRHKSDFPALSDRVLRIQRMAGSDTTNLHHLADEILQDVALTQKLLRLVNSAHFRRDRSPVSTVSRAVALVGQAGIRNLALSLVLVEHMKDKAHAQRLKECFLRAVLAGQLAHEMCGSARDAEEAFLGGMFYNLGPLLTEYYFPEEAQAVRDQLTRHAGTTPANGASAPHPDLLADQVASQVLGLGFADLGMGVARHWGLPESLQHCMRRPEGHSPPRALSPGPERLRWLSLAANEAAEAIWRSDDDTLPKALDAVVQRHGRALGLGLTELKQAGENARGTLAQMAPAMGLTLPRNRLASTDAAMPPVTVAAREASADMLAAGIQDIADALASESVPLSALLHMVLETIYRALGCQRVVFCLRDASGQRLTGRFGLGDQAKLLSPRFDIPLRTVSGQPPDLFGAVCLKGVDTLVPDLQRRDVEAMLPTWFRQRVVARSMLLLPLVLRGAPLGLIYADHAMRMPLGERERVKLRELRDLAAQAFRRSGQ